MRWAGPDDELEPDELEDQGPDQDLAVRPNWRDRLARFLPIVVWVLTVASFAYAFIRVFGLERTWLGYALIAFTPYVAVASLLPLLLAAVTRRKAAAIISLIAAFALASVLAPRAVGQPDRSRGPALRVMSANLKLGGGDPATIVRLVRQHHIDVLALQELTPTEDSRLRGAGLAALLPYSVTAPRRAASGSAIYSRYPLADTGSTVEPEYFMQAYATVQIPGAQPLLIVSVHPLAPATPGAVRAWRTTLRREPPATPRGPVRLLVGDFNATLDHAVLRRLIDTGYHDAAAQLGDGLVTTWPYDGTGMLVPKVTLDHALADRRIGVSSFAAEKVPDSDHRAIVVTLTLPHA